MRAVGFLPIDIRDLELKEQKVSESRKTMFYVGIEAKVVEVTLFSNISVAQLSQNRESDCDIHAGPSTQADYQEIIPNRKKKTIMMPMQKH